MLIVKRVTVVLGGLACAGILLMSCEKMDGPDPYLSKTLANNQIVVQSNDPAVPESVVPLDSMKILLVTDSTFQAVPNNGTDLLASINPDKVAQIIFR